MSHTFARACVLIMLLLAGGCTNAPAPASDTTRQQQAAIEGVLPRLAAQLRQERPAVGAMAPIFEAYLRGNAEIYGVAFAPAPPAGGGLAAPAVYVYRKNGALTTTNLTPPGYNYPQMEWYNLPRTRQMPIWTAPYFDRGGGNIWMMTYSYPIYLDDAKTQLFGIVTSDLPVPAPR